MLSSLLVSPVSAPISWSEPRPSGYTVYNETIGSATTDDIASIGMGVHIVDYVEAPAPDVNDLLRLRISASANTRKGIQYDVREKDHYYDWLRVSEPTGITGDNVWVPLPLYFTVLFYGVEYSEVWVSDDGLLSFDEPPPEDPPPQSIPTMTWPNSLIAPFWRNLNPARGGSITYGRDIYFNGAYYFVVSWNGVPDSNDDPQTFQVLIQHRQGFGSENYHNYIYFQYDSITKNSQTTVGVEDQVGNKGTSYDYSNLHDDACLEFSYTIQGYRLEKLSIILTKSDGYAKIEILETNTGGYNVLLSETTNPFGEYIIFAIKTAASLLLLKAGIMWKILLITAETAGILANNLSPVEPIGIQDAFEPDPEAYVKASCRVENATLLKPFDSTLSTEVLWMFTDPNDEDHDLTITAEATYQDLETLYYYTIPTDPVTLNMYIGHELTVETHTTEGSEITDIKVWIDGNQSYSPVTVDVDPGNHTIDLEHNFWRGAFKYVFLHWEDGSTENPRIVNVESVVSVTAYYNVTYQGTCPTLFVWNGSEYVYETLLDIHGDSDVTLQHRIEQALVPQKGSYKLSLRELDEFTSHIDYVKLHVVDSDDGEIHETHLTKAIHNELGDVKELLRRDDNSRVDLTPSQTIDLKFAVPNIDEVAYFIFEINGHNKKIP